MTALKDFLIIFKVSDREGLRNLDTAFNIQNKTATLDSWEFGRVEEDGSIVQYCGLEIPFGRYTKGLENHGKAVLVPKSFEEFKEWVNRFGYVENDEAVLWTTT